MRSVWAQLTVLTIAIWQVFGSDTHAQSGSEMRVYPGYVVELPMTFSAAVLGGRQDSYNIRHRAGAAALVSPRNDSLQALSAEPTPFDPNDTTCKDLLAAGALSCSPNFEIRLNNVEPNDPHYPDLWGLSAIEAPRAWKRTVGSHEVVVAVIDTGVDYEHADLAANMWRNPGEIAGNGRDDDGNGYIDDVHGINTLNQSGDPYDDNGHGTHVAGTIGAQGNNGVGVVGVNWSTKIMALKFLSANGSGSLFGAIEAVEYVNMMRRRGVNVMIANASWGGGVFSQALYAALHNAYKAGIIVVAAAGNSASDNDSRSQYPANYELDNIVSVAALDPSGNLASFSNYGVQTVDMAAPGSGILSTVPGGYRKLSGTSMAAPHVSGALALLLASEPGLDMSGALSRLYLGGRGSAALRLLVRTGRALDVGQMLYNENTGLPVSPPRCDYTVEQIDYSPDLSADGEPVMLRADEYNYTAIDLPFEFPFFGESSSRLMISPNGVLYIKGAPSGMDYRNGSSAPAYSIAALHTDLIAEEEEQGVRVKISDQKVSVFWRAKHYHLRGASTDPVVDVRLTLYSNGTVEKYLSFSGDADLESMVQQRATVGIAAGGAEQITYAHNDSAIEDQMAVRYMLHCEEPTDNRPVELSKIAIRGINAKGKLAAKLRPNGRFQIDLTGTGTGLVEMQIGLNKMICAESVPVFIEDGSARMVGRLRLGNQRSQRLTAAVRESGLSGSAKIRAIPNRTRAQAIRARQLDNMCGKIISQLSAASW